MKVVVLARDSGCSTSRCSSVRISTPGRVAIFFVGIILGSDPYVGFAPKNNDSRVWDQTQVQTPFSLQSQKESIRTEILFHAWASSRKCETALKSKFYC